MTCLHNLYNEEYDWLCQEIIFIPGVEKGFINDKTEIFKSTGQDKILWEKPTKSMGFRPLREELALVMLDEPVPVKNLFKISKGSINIPK